MSEPVVKICGLQTVEAAEFALDHGSDLLGVILVPNRARTVKDEVALQISQLTHQRQKMSSQELLEGLKALKLADGEYFEKARDLILANGPYLVGVFRNQSVEEVVATAKRLDLDFVQLHGSEDVGEYVAALCGIPVIARYVLGTARVEQSLATNVHAMALLDSEAGGEGKLIDWGDAAGFGEERGARFLLAGGLKPENVANAVKITGCLGVDVSGGVETDGVKDLDKVKSFIENAKSGYYK